MAFTSPEDPGRWLKTYHAVESELWVKIFKKESGIPGVAWNEVVIETVTKSNRHAIAYGLTTVKKSETRHRRFEKFVDMPVREEKPDFGFFIASHVLPDSPRYSELDVSSQAKLPHQLSIHIANNRSVAMIAARTQRPLEKSHSPLRPNCH